MESRREALRAALDESGVMRLAPSDVILVTDFDGTLSEIVSDPSQAVINQESLEALRRLSCTLGHVAILSSRSAGELEQRVPVECVELIGDSGLGDMTSDERRRIDMFNVEASRVLADVPGVWMEA